ncbi:MAG: right-handed parallel beta-helix repeat-containing protein, partial [Armatimonadetes bacterium]|nr:right-handed parallel beta-helix repeat-containing protein [Armatimonadota bacterium]
MKARGGFGGLAGVIGAVLAVLVGAPSALGATIVVTNTNDSGPGSLRAAMGDANATAGPDTIQFDIPGAGPHVIQPLSRLPDLTDPGTTIDGTSQPGYAGSPVVVLNGSLAVGAYGLGVSAGGTVIQGLGITGFAWYGIAAGGQGSGTIERNVISNNGGGIALTQVSAATVRSNLITGNWRTGLFCCGPGSRPTISGNTISGNTDAYLGGGISCIGASPTIEDNEISGNTAGSNGGGIYCCGASAQPELRNNTLSGNSAGGNGGGVAVDYGSSPTIRENTLTGNTAGGLGGGLSASGSGQPAIQYNTFAGNHANVAGGGIQFYCGVGSDASVKGNNISGNTTDGSGGGIWCGGGSSPTVEQNQLRDNVAGG